jgi:LysM repeat protein
MDDDAKNECFRKYKEPLKSYKDHSKFLSTRRRYAFLFELDITDYKGWAHGLKKAGYATNPRYPQLLIKIIEDNGLFEYDKLYKIDRTKLAKNVKPENVKPNNDITPENAKYVETTSTGRKVYSNNDVKFIFAKTGDNPYAIAKEFNIYKYQVTRYNFLTTKDTIKEGQIIYLEKKKNKGKDAYHIVQSGETLYDISEKYAVKLKKLCKYNNLPKNAKLYPDQKIKLR